MIVGIPQGLYYNRFNKFLESFLNEIHIETVTSTDTNKTILNNGIKYAVDEACLPIKIFHGHVYSLIDKCDIIIIPRIIKNHHGEYICPKFCGLPEMIIHSIPNLPKIISTPIDLSNNRSLYAWCMEIGKYCNKHKSDIILGYKEASIHEVYYTHGFEDKDFTYNIGLLGHVYNIYDIFSNMNIIKKLHTLDVGIITEEKVDNAYKEDLLKKLIKKPFWADIREIFSPALYLVEKKKVDGLILLSSFQCGIDSVIIEFIKDYIGNFPLLVLKVDEHSGEAGMNTRIEAFTDMLKRRTLIDNNISAHG